MPTPQPEPQYVRTIRAAALLFWGFGGMAISLAGLAAIAYFAITEQWDEIDAEVKRINSAV